MKQTTEHKTKKRPSFLDWYGDAEEYYRTHGNLLVPAEYRTGEGKPLGRWIILQRERYARKGRYAGSAPMPAVFPEGSASADLLTNSWVVEYEPETLTVYSMFYSENEEGYYSNDYRDKAKRTEGDVGYYNGSLYALPEKTAGNLTCDLRIENNEQLTAFAEVHTPNLTEPFTDVYGDERFKLTLTVTGLSGGETSTLTLDLGTFDPDSSGAVTTSFVLDRLTEEGGSSFAALVRDTGIKPGDSLEVTLEVESVKGSFPRVGASAYCSSLFADETEVPALTGGSTLTAHLACGRHLQNLNNVYAVDFGETVSVRAVQDGTVDWSGADNDLFVPIDNPGVVSYNGMTQELQNLKVETEKDAGLFGVFYGEEIARLTLRDASVEAVGTDGTHAGLLAARTDSAAGGELNLVTVKSCVAANSKVSAASGDAGGLVGRTEAPLMAEACFATDVTVKADAGSAGGLVGSAAEAVTLSGTGVRVEALLENAGSTTRPGPGRRSSTRTAARWPPPWP